VTRRGEKERERARTSNPGSPLSAEKKEERQFSEVRANILHKKKKKEVGSPSLYLIIKARKVYVFLLYEQKKKGRSACKFHGPGESAPKSPKPIGHGGKEKKRKKPFGVGTYRTLTRCRFWGEEGKKELGKLP